MKVRGNGFTVTRATLGGGAGCHLLVGEEDGAGGTRTRDGRTLVERLLQCVPYALALPWSIHGNTRG